MDGIVLLTEKRSTSKLMVSDTVEKIFKIDSNIGAAVSGLIADSKYIIEHARNNAQTHWFNYNENIPVQTLAQAICDLSLRFGEDGSEDSVVMSRPFGVALLLGGVDSTGFTLIYADPSGTYAKYSAKAIGSGAEVAQTTLEEKWSPSLSMNDGKKLGLSIMKNIMEDKLTQDTVHVCIIDKSGFKLLSSPEIESALQSIA